MKQLFSPLLAAAALALAACTTSTGPAAPAVPVVAAGAPATAGKTEILWLGHSATRITTPGGKVIVIDPWLSNNPRTPAGFKQLPALGKVDLILVTHGHFDHFADAPALAQMHKVPMYGPAGLNHSVRTLGILPPELAPTLGKGGTLAPWGPTGPKITAVRADHSSELEWKDAAGKAQVHPGGEPVGYILQMENGFTIWHTGDTAVFGDMRLIADIYRPDVVMLPIGGHFAMGPAHAALAVRELIRPRYAIPVHYGTNPNLRGTPAEFQAALGAAPVRVLVPEPGQKVDF